MVIIQNADKTMWNKDDIILDIVDQMINNAPRIDVSVNNEGPCATSLGLYDMLDKLCARYDYDKSKIFISTCNLVEPLRPDYNIIRNHLLWKIHAIQKHFKQVTTTGKQFDENFKTFGHFIGHGNCLRLFLGSYLHSVHADNTLQTYHCDVKSDYHRPFLGVEDLLYNDFDWTDFDRAVDLLKTTPIKLDSIDQYPILNPATLNITKVYPNFFVEIASMTYVTGTTFHTDEKIWRPMLMKTPFIIQGPQNYIKNLQALGFKTFSDYWDEGYSEDPPEYQGKEIVKLVDTLSKLSMDEVKKMYESMLPILEHNHQRVLSLTDKDFNDFKHAQQ